MNARTDLKKIVLCNFIKIWRDLTINTLNEKQRKLVEDNHNLIYSFMREHFVQDDDYDLIAIGLCKAALSYDENSGFRFSTFAYRCMQNELRKDIQWKNRSRRKRPDDYGDNAISVLKNDSMIYDKVNDTKIVIDDVLRSFAERKRNMLIDVYYNDMTTIEAGLRSGVTSQYVCQVCDEFRKMIRKELIMQ